MNPQGKTGRSKDEHPELYCPERRCLWRTAKADPITRVMYRIYEPNGRCPRHGGKPCAPVLLARF